MTKILKGKRVSIQERRLRAIKPRHVVVPKKCICCKDKVNFEKMWKVDLWAMNRRVNTTYFCQKCMPTAEDVLQEIDKKYFFGIAFVDRW